jgi:SP family facilitated glucose transporter-like MFS transporter 3
MGQQFCGINAVFYYSTSFFQGIIDNPLIGTTIVGAVNVVATYVALLLMDSCGRKTLILWSSGGMFLSCVVIVMALLGIFSNIWALVAVNVYVTFFEIGLGPIPWLIVAEMFDAKYVAVAMATCSQVNWACNFIVGLVFPYMNQYLGPYSFAPFALVLGCTFVFALFILPETQGTTPDELAAEMVRRNSKSMVYHSGDDNTGVINEEWRKAMEQLMQEEEDEMKAGSFDYGFLPIEGEDAPPSNA